MNPVRRTLAASVGLLAGWCIAGCSHQPPKVECDRKLVPINVPAPAESQKPMVPAAPEDGTP